MDFFSSISHFITNILVVENINYCNINPFDLKMEMVKMKG